MCYAFLGKGYIIRTFAGMDVWVSEKYAAPHYWTFSLSGHPNLPGMYSRVRSRTYVHILVESLRIAHIRSIYQFNSFSIFL